MIGLLADLVNIDSGSYDKSGVDAVGGRLQTWLEAAGISCETFPNDVFGDCMGSANSRHLRRQPADRDLSGKAGFDILCREYRQSLANTERGGCVNRVACFLWQDQFARFSHRKVHDSVTLLHRGLLAKELKFFRKLRRF